MRCGQVMPRICRGAVHWMVGVHLAELGQLPTARVDVAAHLAHVRVRALVAGPRVDGDVLRLGARDLMRRAAHPASQPTTTRTPLSAACVGWALGMRRHVRPLGSYDRIGGGGATWCRAGHGKLTKKSRPSMGPSGACQPV
jgi:hypothetical protein